MYLMQKIIHTQKEVIIMSNTQNNFMDSVIKNKTRVNVIMINGYQQPGVITGYDNFSVLVLRDDGVKQLMFKHAISTVIPMHK